MDLAKRTLISMMTVGVACTSVISVVSAAEIRGTIKLGGVIVDEEAADLSAMQETYNIYEGFSAAEIKLDGSFNPKTYFTLSLNDINLDNRKSDFEFWVPGRFKFFTRYDQHRQVFDPDRTLSSTRKDLRFGTWLAPVNWFKLTADYDYQMRDGERVGFPLGVQSELGNGYDDVLQTGRVEGEMRRGSTALAVAYDFSDYSDDSSEMRNRFGYVVSARLRAPGYFTDKVTHLLRAGYGRREIKNVDTEYTLLNFQYTGVAAPIRVVQLKYNFFANRTDDKSTQLKTDNFRNHIDATYFHPRGAVFGGYGYETNDDDRSLTSYHTYTVGGSFRGPKDLAAKVEYANRSKRDEEKHTLLRDIETATFLAKLQVSPVNDLVLGAGYKNREREFSDIGVESEGRSANVYGRYGYDRWGSIGVEYTYSKDEYDDRISRFGTENSVVTSRADFERVRGLRLGGGVTYLDVGGDLDIEKSVLFAEAEYTLLENYRIEVKYNVYNYDDYILLDRYYTANIVWINVAYDFDFQNQ